MAFFGLTALGPQNSFHVSLLDFSYLDVFTPADQEKAFGIVDVERRGYLELDQVSASLARTSRDIPHVHNTLQCLYKAS